MSKPLLNASMTTTTFRLAFRISHSLPLSGEVEKHGHSMFLEVCFANPKVTDPLRSSEEYFLWLAKIKATLRLVENRWDGSWIDDFFAPATSENFLLFIYKKMQQEFIQQGVELPISMALQETVKNRFVLRTV